jgi:hypothetical protein
MTRVQRGGPVSTAQLRLPPEGSDPLFVPDLVQILRGVPGDP